MVAMPEHQERIHLVEALPRQAQVQLAARAVTVLPEV